jgi:hypothetical protein
MARLHADEIAHYESAGYVIPRYALLMRSAWPTGTLRLKR